MQFSFPHYESLSIGSRVTESSLFYPKQPKSCYELPVTLQC
nr:MAG TPA: hypothetical protein [Caudoviricetes sp.]